MGEYATVPILKWPSLEEVIGIAKVAVSNGDFYYNQTGVDSFKCESAHKYQWILVYQGQFLVGFLLADAKSGRVIDVQTCSWHRGAAECLQAAHAARWAHPPDTREHEGVKVGC